MADFATLAAKAKEEAKDGEVQGFTLKSTPFVAAAAAAGDATEAGDAEGGAEGGGAGEAEEESTAHFEPVVHLDEVEVKTHEEDEETLYKQRAKLFVYGETLLNKGTGIKEWRERGIGDVKFLRHKEQKQTRMLMRQEKTMKIIANHIVDPRIVLKPNAGSDKAWVWTAFDFHANELVETVFAIKFSTPDIAQEFKKQFETSMKEMEELMKESGLLEGEGEESEAVDEAAKALDGLSVGGGGNATAPAPEPEKSGSAEAEA